MPRCRLLVLPAAALFWLAVVARPAPAPAQGQVVLELVTGKRVPVTAQQEWARRLPWHRRLARHVGVPTIGKASSSRLA